jgi:hypothetical protein
MDSFVAIVMTTTQPPIDTPAIVKRECHWFGPEASLRRVMEWAKSLEGTYTKIGNVEILEAPMFEDKS